MLLVCRSEALAADVRRAAEPTNESKEIVKAGAAAVIDALQNIPSLQALNIA